MNELMQKWVGRRVQIGAASPSERNYQTGGSEPTVSGKIVGYEDPWLLLEGPSGGELLLPVHSIRWIRPAA